MSEQCLHTTVVSLVFSFFTTLNSELYQKAVVSHKFLIFFCLSFCFSTKYRGGWVHSLSLTRFMLCFFISFQNDNLVLFLFCGLNFSFLFFSDFPACFGGWFLQFFGGKGKRTHPLSRSPFGKLEDLCRKYLRLFVCFFQIKQSKAKEKSHGQRCTQLISTTWAAMLLFPPGWCW